MNNIIGFDFSINKPAACVYSDHQYKFFSWPFGLSEKDKTNFRLSEINLFDRIDEKYKEKDSTEKMRWEVKNAQYISGQIFSNLRKYLNERTLIVFEGLSYGSSGNMAIQLGGYKYILMNALSEITPINNMFTYAPITIKKTANCSKKGMGKSEMIKAFINTGLDIPLINSLKRDPALFQKRTGTWIEHLDDIVDSFWVVETLRIKENI